MKYYRVQIIKNIDIKKLFVEYCQENLESCLQTKKVSYSKSPSRFAEKYLQRVYLFINKHYNEDYDKSAYKNSFISYGDRKAIREKKLKKSRYKLNDYREESSNIQQQYLSNRFRSFIIDFTINVGIIECDNIYISPNSDFTNITKCLGYRIPDIYYSKKYGFKQKRIKVYKSVLDNYLNAKQKFYNEADPTFLKDLKEIVQDLKFNDKQFYADHTFRYDLHLEYKKYLSNQQNNRFTFEGYNGHRYHTPVTNLKSDLRKYLYFDDPLEKNSMVDISNMNGYGLAVYLLNYVYEITEHQKDLLSRLIDLYQVFGRYETIEDFTYAMKNKEIYSIFNGVVLATAFDDTEIRELQTMLENELILFSIMSLTGIIYEVLSNLSGLSRKEVKVEFNKTINYPKGGLLNANGFREFFRNIFPNLVNELVYIHKGSKSDVYYLLTRIETDLMIKNVAPELLNMNIRFVTIHDGIFCKSEDSDTIKKTICSEAERLYGFAPNIDSAQMKFDSRDTTNTVESHKKQQVSSRLALVK